MERSRDKRGDRETVSKGNSDDIVSGSFDRTDADKDQREGSDKFCEQRAKLGHLPMQSNCARTDNLVCRCEQSSKVQTPIFREIPTDNER